MEHERKATGNLFECGSAKRSTAFYFGTRTRAPIPGLRMGTWEKKIEGDEKILSVSFGDKDKSKDTESVSERLANEFAGAFLMPKDMVEKAISGKPDLSSKLDSVIKCFGVTDRAAVNRLIMLGVINESN